MNLFLFGLLSLNKTKDAFNLKKSLSLYVVLTQINNLAFVLKVGTELSALLPWSLMMLQVCGESFSLDRTRMSRHSDFS